MRNPFSLRIVNEDLIFNGPGFLSMWGRDNTMSGEPRGGYIRFLRSGVEWHFALPFQYLGADWVKPQPLFKRTVDRKAWSRSGFKGTNAATQPKFTGSSSLFAPKVGRAHTVT